MTGGFKVKASPTQLFLDTSPVIPNVELVNVHPLIKHLFTKEMLTKAVDIPLNYSNKSLLSKLPKFDFKPGYSVSGKELQNIIHQDTFSTKNSKFSKDEEEANCSCGFGIKGDVKKRGNNENSTCSKSVFEQLIPCGKKRRKLSPYDKSKNVEPVHSFSPFQNGRSFSVKESNTGGRLDVVDRFKQNNFDTETREGTKSCQDLSEPSQESLARVVGLLSSTIQALEPAKIQLRFLQQQKIVCLREKMNYQSVITLNTNSRTELSWWIENLRFCNS